MLALKRIVTVLVMAFILLGLLLILVPAVRSSAEGMLSSGPVGLYYALFITGVILLGLQLITENLDSVLLRREVALHNGKINELKAKLYDHQANQRDREVIQRPGTTTALPPVVVEPAASSPAPVYVAEPTRVTPAQPVHDVEHPLFPQSDPGLVNVSLDQPNSVIPTPPTPDADNRPAL